MKYTQDKEVTVLTTTHRLAALILLALVLSGCFGGPPSQAPSAPRVPAEDATAVINIPWNELDRPDVPIEAKRAPVVMSAFPSIASLNASGHSALPVTHVGVRLEYSDRDAVYTESAVRADGDSDATITMRVAPGTATLFLAAVHRGPDHEWDYGQHFTLWFGRLDNISIAEGSVIEIDLENIRNQGQLVKAEWRPQPGPVAEAFEARLFRAAEHGRVFTNYEGDTRFYFPIEIRDVFAQSERQSAEHLVRINGSSFGFTEGTESGWTSIFIGCTRYPSTSCVTNRGLPGSVPYLDSEKFSLPYALYAIPPLVPTDLKVDWDGVSI